MRKTTPPRACALQECSKTAKGTGLLCSMHATRKQRHGDPLITKYPAMQLDQTDWAAFIGSRAQASPSGCLDWPTLKENGYGTVRFRNRKWYAHRASYVLAKGEIPTGLTVDHICFNPACVRPEHLRLLSISENAKRRRKVKRELDMTICPDCGINAVDKGRTTCEECRQAARGRR